MSKIYIVHISAISSWFGVMEVTADSRAEARELAWVNRHDVEMKPGAEMYEHKIENIEPEEVT